MHALIQLGKIKRILNRLNNQRPDHVADPVALLTELKGVGLVPSEYPDEAFLSRFNELAELGEANAMKLIESLLGEGDTSAAIDAVSSVGALVESTGIIDVEAKDVEASIPSMPLHEPAGSVVTAESGDWDDVI